MLREDKLKLLSLGVVIALLAGALLCMNFTPAGEKLFDIDPDQVEEIQLAMGYAWEGKEPKVIGDRETIEAVVEHFNGYRYNSRQVYDREILTGKDVTFLMTDGDSYTVELTPWGIVEHWGTPEDPGVVIYSSKAWGNYFWPLYETMLE